MFDNLFKYKEKTSTKEEAEALKDKLEQKEGQNIGE